jgi:hypothetical protein
VRVINRPVITLERLGLHTGLLLYMLLKRSPFEISASSSGVSLLGWPPNAAISP